MGKYKEYVGRRNDEMATSVFPDEIEFLWETWSFATKISGKEGNLRTAVSTALAVSFYYPFLEEPKYPEV